MIFNNIINIFGKKAVTFLLFVLLTWNAIAQKPLSKIDAERLAHQEWNHEKQQLVPASEKVWNEGVIEFNKYKMAIAYRVFGEKPATGRSLYISLHGGGNAPVDVNNQQWENQRTLYNIKEGLVVVPRAPTNTWNLWHEDHIDNMMDSLIRYAVISKDVDPNKVYILGYSAGGDGVFQLGPRMADRWAAASMMAGHPGDADMRNLRNLPFSIFMGGLDSAYHRNTLAIAYNKKLDSLQKGDPDGYNHEFYLYADRPHWMNRRDTIAISWMEKFTRNPFPKRVVWAEDNRLQHRFYWLSAPISKVKRGNHADIRISGNQIVIEENTFKEIEINLNDELLNLDEAIAVMRAGKILFNKKVNRNLKAIKRTISQYQDPKMFFSVKLVVKGNIVKVFH